MKPTPIRRDRATSRVTDDAYFTPPAVCAAVLPVVADPILNGTGAIIEPAAGALHFVTAIQHAYPPAARRIVAFELTEHLIASAPTQRRPATVIGNTLSFDCVNVADLVIGNPPYRTALDFWRWSIRALKPGGHLLFILRASFACAKGRINDFRKDRPALHFLQPRPSFIRKQRIDRSGEIQVTTCDQYNYAAFHAVKDSPIGGSDWILWDDIDGVQRASATAGLVAPPSEWWEYTAPLYSSRLDLIEPAFYPPSYGR